MCRLIWSDSLLSPCPQSPSWVTGDYMAASSACVHTGDWQTCYQASLSHFPRQREQWKIVKSFLCEPPLSAATTPDRNLSPKSLPSVIAPPERQKKGSYLLGHSLVFQAANVNPVDFDWLESGGVHPEPLLNICHSTCQPLLISNHTFTNRDITRQIPTASECDKSKKTRSLNRL